MLPNYVNCALLDTDLKVLLPLVGDCQCFPDRYCRAKPYISASFPDLLRCFPRLLCTALPCQLEEIFRTVRKHGWGTLLPTASVDNFGRYGVSVICVTSHRDTAHGLAKILGRSRDRISVDWLKAGADVLSGLSLRLSGERRCTPAIILLDFASFGASIWDLILQCEEQFADHNVGWLIVNCEGSIPILSDFPWTKVTVLANSVHRH